MARKNVSRRDFVKTSAAIGAGFWVAGGLSPKESLGANDQMRAGKHCHCQKALTHTIYEADLVGKVAKEMKVATQMGNQGTADANLRKVAEMVRGGAVGNVKDVHVWTNRPIWAQGKDRPASK